MQWWWRHSALSTNLLLYLEEQYLFTVFFHSSCKDIVWWSEHNPGSFGFLLDWKYHCQQHFGKLILCIIAVINKYSLCCKTKILPQYSLYWEQILGPFRGEKFITFFGLALHKKLWKLNLTEGQWSDPERIGFVWGERSDSAEISQQSQNLPWPCASLQY